MFLFSRKNRHKQPLVQYTARQTHDGTYIESASKRWLCGLLYKSGPIRYAQTEQSTNHCCVCEKQTASVRLYKAKSKSTVYFFLLCNDCKHIVTPKRKLRRTLNHGLPYARILYNPVETNRRKF